MSMCLSTQPSNYEEMLHDATDAEIIYSIPYNGGTLYSLGHNNMPKRHATLDIAISSIDKMISKSGSTSFVSISDIRSGKVKTFQTGDHRIDEHYNVIFCNKVPSGRKNNLRDGVRIWTPDMALIDNNAAGIARRTEDLQVQQQAMEEDPTAFGYAGDELTTGGPVQHLVSKKRRADPQYVPPVQANQRQGEPVLNQQKLDSYLKCTTEKLDKLDSDSHDMAKSISGCLLEINDNVIGNFELSDVKIDTLSAGVVDVKQLVVNSHTKLDDIKTEQSDVFLCVDYKLDTIVEKQKGFAKLTMVKDHFERMTFKLRGELGAKAVQHNKPLHRELANRQDEIDSLKYQLAVKDKAFEKHGRRITELAAELQADRKDHEEHDNWVRMEFDNIKSGQAEIIQMLGRLLSDS